MHAPPLNVAGGTAAARFSFELDSLLSPSKAAAQQPAPSGSRRSLEHPRVVAMSEEDRRRDSEESTTSTSCQFDVSSLDANAASTSTAAPAGGGDAVHKAQGYRRLWSLITKVGKGQRLQGLASFQDMTIEDLLQIVAHLPPNASAVQAIGQGLPFLDSRAMAALLKELAKAGFAHRSAEVFDHLRSLPEGHELSHLLNTYTYTTIISQCAANHQLHRALELIDEMRARSVMLNTHTYSALMSVCIKANQMDMALDVFHQMRAEGCVPNIVTFNTLLDLYGKTGRWQEAVATLRDIQQQGIEPEARTYNSVIMACNMAGNHGEALRMYAQMRSLALQPTAATYNAMINAYSKAGDLDSALSMYRAMASKGFERTAASYNALITSCERHGVWEVAVDLLQAMQQEDGMRPGAATYTSVIIACMQGGQPHIAEQLFERMRNSCRAEASTYSCMVTTYTLLGKWRDAINVFQTMVKANQKVEPDAVEALLDALWSTGLLSVQAYALQVHDYAAQASSSELFGACIEAEGGDERVLRITASKPGAALVALSRGLLKLRDHIFREGQAALRRRVVVSIPNPASSPGSIRGAAPQAVACPGPASSPASKEASAAAAGVLQGVAGLLTALQSPFKACPSGAPRLVAPALAAGTWLVSSEAVAARLLRSGAGGAPPAPRDGVGAADGSAIAQQDLVQEGRCREAFATVQALEANCMVNTSAMPPSFLARRNELVALMSSYARVLHLADEVMHDAMLLMDRALSTGLPLADSVAPLLAAGCLLLVAKQSGIDPAQLDERLVGSHLHLQPEALTQIQTNVVMLLGCNNCVGVSAMRVLKLYIERLGCNCQDPQAVRLVAGRAVDAMFDALSDPTFLDCPPSVTAMAVLQACRQAGGISPPWPSALAALTGYATPESPAQQAVAQRLASYKAHF